MRRTCMTEVEPVGASTVAQVIEIGEVMRQTDVKTQSVA
jgi:hypothetical protein